MLKERPSGEVRFVVDVELRRPACVLLQAAMGGDRGVDLLFDTGTWLLAPTDGMRLVSGTMEQWRGFAREANSAALASAPSG